MAIKAGMWRQLGSRTVRWMECDICHETDECVQGAAYRDDGRLTVDQFIAMHQICAIDAAAEKSAQAFQDLSEATWGVAHASRTQ